MNNEAIRSELTKTLVSIFGNEFRKTIDEYYDSDKLDELIELAEHMLINYMGEKNARLLLTKITSKTQSGAK